MKKAFYIFLPLAVIGAAALARTSMAAEPMAVPGGFPSVTLSIGGSTEAGGQGGVGAIIQVVLLITVLTLTPAILLLMTSFTRLVVVFSIIRQAMGIPQAPPNQILIGLALFLTFFIMTPAMQKISSEGLRPYMDGTISQEAAFTNSLAPLKEFMASNTREKDVELFMGLSKGEKPENADDISASVLIPAFVTSELKTAFQIGFLIYLPFLVIDMVVASVLMSMGMMMLPPVMVSLPFKLMLFVLVDGWYLLVGSLVQSFH